MSARSMPTPRGTAALLIKQLARLIGDGDAQVPLYPMLVVEAVATRPWASATFDGERHRFDLRLYGDTAAAGDALDRLVDRLPEHEFDLPGAIVAEARLTSVRIDPDPAATAIALTVEVLTVVD